MPESSDRQATQSAQTTQTAEPNVAGGLFVPDAEAPGRGPQAVQAVLALADGSVWRGWSVGPARAVTGRVRIAGDLVLVEGEVLGALLGVDVVALDGHIAATAAGHGPGTMGYLAAPGAILPIHVEVAKAIARGEIGRP